MPELEGVRVDDLDMLLTVKGSYSKRGEIWWAHCPAEGAPIANLSKHTVTEHQDGTITVSPSILVKYGAGLNQSWHGFLEAGKWKQVP